MAIEEIKVTITAPDIDLRNYRGGLLIARVTERHPIGEMLRVRDGINAMLKEAGLEHVGVILCDHETEIETISEEAMNRLGWFRQPPDFNSPAVVEIAVRADGKVAWVNVDGKCALRASEIKNLVLVDQRDTAQTRQDHR